MSLKMDIPRYIYRGESLSHINDFGRLEFSKPDGKNPGRASWSAKDMHWSSTERHWSDELDLLKFYKMHIKEGDSNNYLSFTNSIEKAKEFATTEGIEQGILYRIDTSKLPKNVFTITVMENLNYINSSSFFSDFRDEKEVGVFRSNENYNIPEDAIHETKVEPQDVSNHL